jgi:hemerythrin-like metal-binding protein
MSTMSRNVYGRLSVTSLKQLLAWGDHFKVGQSQADAQHEAIFHIAMEIADTWQKRGDVNRLKALTDKLASVLAAHFQYEEEQLAAAGYRKLHEHRAEHRMMLEELQRIRGRLDQMAAINDPLTSGFILNNFVLGLTVGHISNSDMSSLPFMPAHR